jgi:hypothetical protein
MVEPAGAAVAGAAAHTTAAAAANATEVRVFFIVSSRGCEAGMFCAGR